VGEGVVGREEGGGKTRRGGNTYRNVFASVARWLTRVMGMTEMAVELNIMSSHTCVY
jgi:hypothetical protein